MKTINWINIIMEMGMVITITENMETESTGIEITEITEMENITEGLKTIIQDVTTIKGWKIIHTEIIEGELGLN